MSYAGVPSFLCLGLEDGHVPTFWLDCNLYLQPQVKHWFCLNPSTGNSTIQSGAALNSKSAGRVRRGSKCEKASRRIAKGLDRERDYSEIPGRVINGVVIRIATTITLLLLSLRALIAPTVANRGPPRKVF